MDLETKNILKILGIAIVVLYLFKPRKKSNLNLDKIIDTSSVTKEDIFETEYQNAVIGIKAYRSAIKNNEPESQLKYLNSELMKEYGVQIFKCQQSGKLTARNMKGKDIAKEE